MRKPSHKAVWLRACLLAGALLFAQSVVAVQACVLPAMAPTMAFSDTADGETCGQMSGNACLMQFLQADQAINMSAGFAIAPTTAFVLTVAFEPAHAPMPPHASVSTLASGPPLRTRHCRLLI